MEANKIRSAKATHPGSVLKEELEARGISERFFATELGLSEKDLKEYIHDRKKFDEALSLKLEKTLGVPAYFWLGLQAEYETYYPVSEAVFESVSCASQKILALTNTKLGDSITNLKLQKLLYFLQGFFLGILGRPLFPEDIEGWKYGPVVPAAYNEYKALEAFAIPNAGTVKDIKLPTEEQERLFKEIYNRYNKYSASYLVSITHKHTIWKRHLKSVIPKDEIQDFFWHLSHDVIETVSEEMC